MFLENIFNNIQEASARDLRYLLYLSQKNKWVQVAGEVYKITIKHIVKDVRRGKEGKRYFAEEYEPVSTSSDTEKELNLKLHLSQVAYNATVFSGAHRDEYCGDHKELLSNLKLNITSHFYHRLALSYYEHDKYDPDCLSGGQLICICLFAENFDAIFTNKIDELTNEDDRIAMVNSYKEQKKSAYEEASKNAIWQAASSGDYVLLESLLAIKADIDLNSIYEGKSILKAMFDNDPDTNSPFKSITCPDEPKQDYASTLDLLVKYGLNKEKIQQFYNHCSKPSSGALYAKTIADQNELLPIFKNYCSLLDKKNNENQVTLNTYQS